MKNIILGTTALVAATALTAGSASAADKIKLNVGGYLMSTFSIVDYDSGDYLPTDLRHEGEVHFTGETTLDNGLTFGVNIQLEARATGDQVDETFMYIKGSFGRINIGSEDSAPYLMHYGSPAAFGWVGVSSPNYYIAGLSGMSTSPNELGDSDKITYFTPRFSGFQFGASFTPDGDEETGTGASPYAGIALEGAEDEAYSIAVNYNNKWDSVSLKASLGYQLVTRETTDDTDEIAVGLTVGFGGFAIGGAYKYTDNDGGTDDLQREDFDVGITYGMGPWKIGFQYGGVRQDDAGDGETDIFQLLGWYDLGAGINLYGGINYEEVDGGFSGGARGDDATTFFIGSMIYF